MSRRYTRGNGDNPRTPRTNIINPAKFCMSDEEMQAALGMRSVVFIESISSNNKKASCKLCHKKRFELSSLSLGGEARVTLCASCLEELRGLLLKCVNAPKSERAEFVGKNMRAETDVPSLSGLIKCSVCDASEKQRFIYISAKGWGQCLCGECALAAVQSIEEVNHLMKKAE